MMSALQAGQICTVFIPVKSSFAVVVSLLSAVHVSALLGHMTLYFIAMTNN